MSRLTRSFGVQCNILDDKPGMYVCMYVSICMCVCMYVCVCTVVQPKKIPASKSHVREYEYECMSV